MQLKMEYFSTHTEATEALSRVLAGGAAAVGLAIFYWLNGVQDALRDTLLQYGVWLYVLCAVLLVVDVKLFPIPKHSRNIISIALDVVGVSAALYLAPGVADPIALFFVWIMLGSGVVYGATYLVLATIACTLAFCSIWVLSAHWQQQPLFAVTILGLMLVLGPYLTMLMRTLHASRREVRWQADHDPLTGLLNRRAFQREVNRLKAGQETHGAMLYMDLDHFKAVNDGAGHAAGDQVLKDVTELIRQCLPETAVAARLGGDEFCVILPDLDTDRARKSAEQLRDQLHTYRLAWGTEYYGIGVSIGVAAIESATDGEALVRLVDAACYAAKNAGRNQVHVVSERDNFRNTQVLRRLQLVKSAS